MEYTRMRGTAIVESAAGIIVVSKDGRVFTLPGGGAEKGESRRDAAIRELKEETGMDAIKLTHLFEFLGTSHADSDGRLFRNSHEVFLVTAKGVPKPMREIKKVAYYKGSQPMLSYSARRIIDRFHASRVPLDTGENKRKKKN